MNEQDIVNQLVPKIERQISEQIVKFYFEAKLAFYQGDAEKSLLKSGKFVEQVCRGLHFISTGVKLDTVDVEQIVRTIENNTSLGDELRMIIPRVMRSIYTFRNKRSVAHSSDIDPTFIDAEICISSLDWTLSELLRLFHNYNESQVRDMMNGLIKKKIPVLQKIDNNIVILDKNISAKNSILLILYDAYPKSLSTDEIKGNLLKYHTIENILTSLKSAEKDRLVFLKDGKCTITENGIGYVQNMFKDRLE